MVTAQKVNREKEKENIERLYVQGGRRDPDRGAESEGKGGDYSSE